MIVKNESKIITRLLQSVVEIIDYYFICDTGSTDDTVIIIQDFFKESGIPGKIIYEPFQDFGYNRTVALRRCIELKNIEFILLLDADMIIKINENFSIQEFKRSLSSDIYYFYQGSDTFLYKNIRLVKKRPGMIYSGVTHEFFKALENSKYETIDKDKIFIQDIGDGGSKTEKFTRDIELLKKGLEVSPDNHRYLFYLANSYRDSQLYKDAIETYHKRIKVGGWNEEIWNSYYSIGNCYKKLNDYPNAIYYWFEAYNFYPDRIENLYEIVKYYRINKSNSLAYTIFKLADSVRKNKTNYDNLFLQRDIYDYLLDYELSIIGYYCNTDNYNIINTIMNVIKFLHKDETILKSVLSNYKFYTTKIADKNIDTLLYDFNKIGQTLDIDRSIFQSSTPSICAMNKNEIIVNVRYVNYKIDEGGKYINKGTIESINVIAIFDTSTIPWKKTKEFIFNYDKAYDNQYLGIEDMRLIINKNRVLYNANRALNEANIVVEQGIIDIEKNENNQSILLNIENQKKIEKNWVLFNDNIQNIKVIYNWFPLTVCDIDENVTHETSLRVDVKHSIETPYFFKYLRGSTNGVNIDDEIWFICHLVSYEERRYYYHIIVVLDMETFELKKYSQLFTFEKSPVEYTLGFIYNETTKRFIIGYSIMDRETKFINVSKFIFDEMMIT